MNEELVIQAKKNLNILRIGIFLVMYCFLVFCSCSVKNYKVASSKSVEGLEPLGIDTTILFNPLNSEEELSIKKYYLEGFHEIYKTDTITKNGKITILEYYKNKKSLDIVSIEEVWKWSGCDYFKTGKFKYFFPDGTFVVVRRTQNRQIENYKGVTFTFSIEWLDSCRYVLKLLTCTDEEIFEKSKSTIVTSTIKEMKNDTSFVVNKSSNFDSEYETLIIKID